MTLTIQLISIIIHITCGSEINILPIEIVENSFNYLNGIDLVRSRICSNWYNIIENITEYGLQSEINKLMILVQALSNSSSWSPHALKSENEINDIYKNIKQILSKNPEIPFILAKCLPKYFKSLLLPLVQLEWVYYRDDKAITSYRSGKYFNLIKLFQFKCYVKRELNQSVDRNGVYRRLRFYQYLLAGNHSNVFPNIFPLKIIDQTSNINNLQDIEIADILKTFEKVRIEFGIVNASHQRQWFNAFKNQLHEINDLMIINLQNPHNFYSMEEFNNISLEVLINRVRIYPKNLFHSDILQNDV